MLDIFQSLIMCSMVLFVVIIASAFTSFSVYKFTRKGYNHPDASGTLRPLQNNYYLRDAHNNSIQQINMDNLEMRGLLLRTISPRPDEILMWARQRWPRASIDELAQHIVNSTASRCGFIGFVTGAPGILALPISLPIDIITSGRLQAAMIQALAYLYEIDEEADDAQRRWFMIMTGGSSATRSLSALLTKIIGPTLLKAVPILGAVTGYAVNYGFAKMAGKTAIMKFRNDNSREGQTQIITPDKRIPYLETSEGLKDAELVDVSEDDAYISSRTMALVSADDERQSTLAAATHESILCSECSNPIMVGAKFCTKCGSSATGAA